MDELYHWNPASAQWQGWEKTEWAFDNHGKIAEHNFYEWDFRNHRWQGVSSEAFARDSAGNLEVKTTRIWSKISQGWETVEMQKSRYDLTVPRADLILPNFVEGVHKLEGIHVFGFDSLTLKWRYGGLRNYYYSVNSSIGLEDEAAAVTFEVYPNPANDVLNFKIDTEKVEMQILTLGGQTVLTTELTRENAEISAGHLPRGIYLCQWQKDGKVSTQKIVLH